MRPGKTDTDREAMASCANGARKAEHEASRRRAGIARESVWIQSAPTGDVAVVVLEAPDIQTAVGTPRPRGALDRWFRDVVRDVHQIELGPGFEPPEQVLDFRGWLGLGL